MRKALRYKFSFASTKEFNVWERINDEWTYVIRFWL